jgi:hypothetical protein
MPPKVNEHLKPLLQLALQKSGKLQTPSGLPLLQNLWRIHAQGWICSLQKVGFDENPSELCLSCAGVPPKVNSRSNEYHTPLKPLLQ